ncbi:hypothetical protein MSSAC_1952 [Methanosarcina siciliae C2J]|uniref:Integral membrane protein n=1 Tax=Methanosarcina siciliae C2J TaxID=1434118 RepID=A0A0E3PNK5_9EURY|nr:lysylphosphatidylglycerol synthase transmembrane domain-containing protein [Methanosarcina siciliae]AKB36542.1 hypothetical protein MSSAC_1952 [Methanosarcina siciliae C2J]
MAKNKIWLTIFFAIAVYVIMGIYADFDKLSLTISYFQWPYAVIMIVFTTVGYFIRYIKWNLFLKKAGIHLKHRNNLFVFFSGLSMIVTPGKFGEVWKGWLIKDISGEDLGRTIPVVIMDRVTDVVSLVILSFFGVFYYKEGISLLLVMSVLLTGFYCAIRSRNISSKIIAVIEKRFGRFAVNLHLMHETLDMTMEPATFISLSLLNSLAWFFECLGLYYVILGFGQSLDIALSTFIFSFSSLAGGVSMIPGGIGVAEASISGLLMLNDISPELSISIALILRLGSFWYGAVLGFAVYILFRKRVMKEKNLLLERRENV